jgi:hypothetical protein
MFSLPKELQDCIYSFDDNTYYKSLYKNVINEILNIYYFNLCMLRISIHDQYDIYLKNNSLFHKLSFKQYLISRNIYYNRSIFRDTSDIYCGSIRNFLRKNTTKILK